MLKMKKCLPTLTLLLCVAFVALLPITAMATAVTDFSSFTYASYFTADYTVASTTGSASASGATLSLSATGVNATTGCNATPAVSSTTTITLTANETVSVTCTPKSTVTMSPPSEVTSNSDGSKTFIVAEGQKVTFAVIATNATEVTGSVTFSSVEPAESKVPTDCAAYTYNGTVYNYLDKVIEAATTNGGTITVTTSGKVYHSSVETDESYASKTFTYNIPSNVNLLLPYASGKSNFDEKPDMSTTSKFYYNTQSVYSELLVPSNTTINCAGKICVDSQIFADTLYSGCPGGPHGRIVLEQGSSLNMQSGSTLYCWGYITGVASNGSYTTGAVTAKSGSTIYESFQALGWRGGNLMKKWMNSSSSKSFGFSDYALQNIESNLQIDNGANLKFVTSLEGSGTNAQVTGTFVDNTTGFLQMGSNGAALRTYDPYNNRIKYTLNGTMNIASVKMTLASLGSIDSQKYIFGMNPSMDIVINSEANVTMLYDYKIMPGASVTINQGGKATVNGKVYIYDTTDYVIDGLTYAHHQSYTHLKSVPVAYIAATGYKSEGFSNIFNAGISQIGSSTPSGKVVINGELTIASTGGVYTSSNGGKTVNKVITGTGIIINNSAATSIVTDQLDEAKTIYNNAFSQSVEDQNKVVTPVVGLIKGLSASASDYLCFTPGTYYGSADGYWYQYQVSTVTDGGEPQIVGQIGNGSTISYTSNVASGLTAANGVYTFIADGYEVATSNGTLTDNGDGTYTLSGVTADTIVNLTSPCPHETKTLVDGQGATCTEDGWNSYYQCDACEKTFSDEVGESEITDLEAWKLDSGKIPPTGHLPLIEFPETPSTCTTPGNAAYWQCERCEKYFSDEAGETEIADLEAWLAGDGKIESPGHTYGDVTYDWTGYTACVATRNCTVESCTAETEGHTETANATIKNEVTKEATCSAPGERTYTATFAVEWASEQTNTETIAIDENAHAWENDCDTTCNNDPSHTREATHSYDSAVTAPTCTNGGFTTHTCTICGNTYKDTETSALSHDEVTHDAKAPTCTAIGWDTYVTCSRCDYSTYAEKAALGHTEAAAVKENEVAATCGKAGSYDSVVKCSICGTELSRETITVSATGAHTWNDGVITKEATCKETGVKTFTCSVCQDTRTEAVDMIAHNYKTLKQDEANHWYECTCGEKYNTAVHADTNKDHKCDTCEYVISQCADNNSDHNCDTCGKIMTECADENTDHKCDICGTAMGTHEAAEGKHTCDYCNQTVTECSDGDDADHKCDICGKDDITDHSYTAEATEPTCTTEGYTTYTCACGDSYIDNVVPAAHTIAQGAAQAKTCAQDGWEAYEYCTKCDYSTKVVIPAGHTLTQVGAKAPTCTEAGYEAYEYCSKCDYTTYKVTAATNHQNTTVKNAANATCNAAGYTGDTYCNDCQTIIENGTSIPATEHSFTSYESIGGDLATAVCDNGCGSTDTRVAESNSDNQVEVVPGTDSTTGTSANVTVGKDLLDEIANQELELYLNSSILELIFNNTALKNIVTEHKDKSSVSIVVENTTPADATGKLVFDIHLEVDGVKQEFSDFGEGEVTVTIPLDKLNLTDKQTVKVWYVKDGVRQKEMPHEHNRNDNHVKFHTNHFSEYEVEVVNETTSETMTVTFDNKTGTTTPATINAPTSGSVGSAYTFTVTCEKACVVAYTTDGGATYTRLTANADDASSFTVTLADGMEFVVAIKGDVDGNGKIRVADVVALAQMEASGEYTEYKKLIADMDENGKIRVADVVALAQLEAQG